MTSQIPQTTSIGPDDLFRPRTQPVLPIRKRHGFCLSPVRRDITEDDLRRDRGTRSYETLFMHAERKPLAGPPKTTLSVFTERHSEWRPSQEEQAALRKAEQDEAKREKAWLAENPNLPYSRKAKSEGSAPLNTISPLRPSTTTTMLPTPVKPKSEQDEYAINAVDEMKAMTVQACQGRLDRKILDFEARSSVMGTEQYRTYLQNRESISQDMQNEATSLGKLTEKIASHPAAGAEAVLQGYFVQLANAVESSLAEAIGGAEPMMGTSGTFQSLGDADMFDDDRLEGLRAYRPRHRIDILMHGNRSQGTNDRTWNRALSFGEVKSTPAEDLKDSLLGQVMVYVLKKLQNTPISGKLYFFTQCGPILRVWWADAETFGTSTALDFRKASDFNKIIDVLAFFSGPAHQIAEQWSVEKGSLLEIENLGGCIHKYEVSDTKWLACTGAVFGTRTVAWMVDAKPLSESCPSPPEAGMKMIIKSTWVRPSQVKQELRVLVHLHEPLEGDAEHGLRAHDGKSDIPYPLGMVRNTFINDKEQSTWTTTQKDRQNSTMATFCVPAQVVPDDVKARDRFWLLEGFFQKVRLMTERGVLYRDVNEGNIMQNTRDESRAVIIDFGNARIGSLDDEQEFAQSDPASLDAKIARSVNKIFSSRRVHRLVDLEAKRSREEKTVQRTERKLRRTTEPGAKRKVEEALMRSRKPLEKTISRLRRDYAGCCHLDDCESGMLWYLYSSATSYKRSPQAEIDSRMGDDTDPGVVLDMTKLDKKNEVWETEYYKVFLLLDTDIETHFKRLRDEIDEGHQELELLRDRPVSAQDRRLTQIRRIDKCLQIFNEARLELDEISKDFQAQMSMGSSDHSDSDDSS